jgi:serine O-acetyltransferase
VFDNLKADIKRYTEDKVSLKSFIYLAFTQGLWAIAVYRYGSWANKIRIPLLGQFLRLIYYLLFKVIEIATGISLDCNAKIGSGIYIGHFGQIFIHSDVEIGENLSLGQGVTIGTLGLGRRGAPKIGNNIYIGVGAKILGEIKIGDNVRIGANAVVIQDIPNGCTVVGIPGKIIQRKDDK